MNSVDSFYEYLGYSFCGSVDDVLRALWIPILVALAGVVAVCIRTSERGEPRILANHLFYLLLAIWLISPTTLSFDRPAHHFQRDGTDRVQKAGATIEVRVPRILHYANAALDGAVGSLYSSLSLRMGAAPFEWERIARMVSRARIHDPSLRIRVRQFLEGCHERRVARLRPGSPIPNPLEESPSVFPSEDLVSLEEREMSCAAALSLLRTELQRHVQSNPDHRKVVETAKRHDGGAGFIEAYARSIAFAEWMAPDPEASEENRVATALGPFEYYEPSGPFDIGANLREALAALGGLKQSWAMAQEPKQQYYLVVLFGPHLYGFSLLTLLGLFPLLASASLAPGGWRPLVHFGKLFLSIKLWPVLWAAISLIRGNRSSLSATEEFSSAFSREDVWVAGVAMYLLTPALTLMVVQLLSRVATTSFASAVPGPAGGVSPAAALILDRVRSRR